MCVIVGPIFKETEDRFVVRNSIPIVQESTYLLFSRILLYDLTLTTVIWELSENFTYIICYNK